MITFKIRPHRITPGREVVEVLLDDKPVAAFYTGDKDGNILRLISENFASLAAGDDFVQISFYEPTP